MAGMGRATGEMAETPAKGRYIPPHYRGCYNSDPGWWFGGSRSCYRTGELSGGKDAD